MNKQTELISIIIVYIIAGISSLVVIGGFIASDASLVINASRFLALSSLILVSYFGWNVYRETQLNTTEVRMELHSKEDIEKFRKKIDDELQQYIKEIAEEEEEEKDS